jgi:hypothetical protein
VTTSNFEVALSFAGEDRSYVEAVASHLKGRGVRVFYDAYEKVDLWGKDLYAHLTEVYGDKSRYVVMFISRHYADKVWPNHERRSAQARALVEKGEYLLPARFDDTPIPGLLPTVAYISLAGLAPSEFGRLIEQKIGRNSFWQKEAGIAAEYVATHWFLVHRGVFLWIKGVSVAFANDNGMLGHSYIATFRNSLGTAAVLGEAKNLDGGTIALLIDSNDARALFEKLWECFEKDYVASGGHNAEVEVRSNQAFAQLHSYFDTPANISR